MTTTTALSATQREPALRGQTVVVIGGSAGIGLETARLARAEGGEVIVTGRNPERLERAARELGALGSAAATLVDAVPEVVGASRACGRDPPPRVERARRSTSALITPWATSSASSP
jgi:NAD(P)-dependent dehydrogenase (short-subunit alcohol dehydrogenase family)